MAILPTSGSLNVTQINTLKSLGTAQTSLTTRELQYMGGNPANANTSQVCFPNQVERVSSSNWTYNGASVAWRPTRVSEFRGAYNNVPSVSVTYTGTGNRAIANFKATCSNSSIYTGAGTPYSVYGTGAGITHPNLNAWVVCTGSSGTVYDWNSATVSTGGTVTLTVYVKDFQNCGTMNEFSGTRTYP